MILPKQAPPVVRTNVGIGGAWRCIGMEPAQTTGAPKIGWRCTTVQADQDDATKIEAVLSYNIPGATSGWVLADSPCTP